MKRFTDSAKWRNAWFRKMPLEAKLTWIYLCDECDFAGVWKADYELASFQLGFDINPSALNEWFGDKVYFFGDDRVLILKFFEFQYGESKDTWSAKVKAKSKLESLGFFIQNNRVTPPHSGTTVPPQWYHSPPTVLIIGVGTNKEVSTNSTSSNFKEDLTKGEKFKKPASPPSVPSGQGRDVSLLIGTYIKAWQRRYKTSARPDVGGKTRGVFQRLLKDHKVSHLAELLQVYCQMTEPKWFETKRHDLVTFEMNLNNIALALDKGLNSTEICWSDVFDGDDHGKELISGSN